MQILLVIAWLNCRVSLFSSVQLLSRGWLFAIPWTPGFPVHHQLSKPTQTHVHWVYLIHCHPLLLLPSIFPSIRVFSSELVLCIRWPKYWSFSFSISPSNEYSGFISFMIDWLDLIAVQGTLKNLFQHHSFRNLQKALLVLPGQKEKPAKSALQWAPISTRWRCTSSSEVRLA